MTIANYNSLPNIRINYIKRRDGISALVVNQETKEEVALSIGGGLTISDDYFDIDIKEIKEENPLKKFIDETISLLYDNGKKQKKRNIKRKNKKAGA